MAERIETDLIVRAIAEGFDKMEGVLGETASEVKKLEETTQKGAKGLLAFRGANQDAAGAARAFGVDLAGMSNPLTLIATGLKSSIDFTTQWGDTLDRLSRTTGENARETSKLAIVLGNMGVNTGALEQAAKSLKDQGLTPNLATIKQLAAQYQSIQDPVERNKWGIKTLGRAYFELGEVLTKTPEQFDELTAAAERSGKIMDEAAIQKAEDYGVKLSQLQDKVDGAKIAFGSFAIDGLMKAGQAATDYIGIYQALWIKAQQMTGAIDDNSAAWQAAMLAGADYNTTLDAMGLAYDVEDGRARRAAEATELHTDATIDAKAAEDELKASKDLSNSVYAMAEAAIGKANIGLAQQIELTEALALASGKMTAEEFANKEAVGFLTKQLELGKITMDEYKAAVDALASGSENARNIINEVGRAIEGLPSSKDIFINVHNAAAGEAGIGPSAPIQTTPEAPTTDRFQHGGPFIISPGLNENFPIGGGGASSGERVTVTPAGGGGGAEYQMMLLQMEGRMTRAFRDALLLARG